MRGTFDSTVFRSRERVDAWRDATCAALVPTEIDIPDRASFSARMRAALLGPAQVTTLAYPSLTCRRTTRLIRVSDPEHYLIGVIRSGRQGIDQHGTSALLGAGDLVVYDSSHPFEAVNISGTAPAESLVLQFPRRLLPLPYARMRDLCATAIPGTRGMGRLLTQFLATLTDLGPQATNLDALRLGHTAIDLTAAVLAHHLERDHLPVRSPSYVLYLRVLAFIDQHLRHPQLHPDAIAAAHRISPRYLHRIFQQHHHTSVSAHIRRHRMDSARRDLADPRLDHLTIASIGARWGFPRPADFSRAFHRHTGQSPRAYRANT